MSCDFCLPWSKTKETCLPYLIREWPSTSEDETSTYDFSRDCAVVWWSTSLILFEVVFLGCFFFFFDYFIYLFIYFIFLEMDLILTIYF